MSIEKIRTQIIASIWQAFAQSETDLSAVPHNQQEELVNKIADNVMLAMDKMMDEAVQEVRTGSMEDEYEEPILWEGRPFLSIVEDYLLTTERISIVSGFLSRKIENFELIRVQDIDYKQGITERMLGIGDIFIKQGKLDDAKLSYENAAGLDPVSKGGYYNRLGNTLAGEHNHKMAIEAFEKAISADPHNPFYYLSLVKSCEIEGSPDKAGGTYKKAKT